MVGLYHSARVYVYVRAYACMRVLFTSIDLARIIINSGYYVIIITCDIPIMLLSSSVLFDTAPVSGDRQMSSRDVM